MTHFENLSGFVLSSVSILGAVKEMITSQCGHLKVNTFTKDSACSMNCICNLSSQPKVAAAYFLLLEGFIL